MNNSTVWIIMAFVAGSFLPIQAGLNAKMGKAIASPVYASLISFIGGAVALLLYVLVTRQSINFSDLKSAPSATWLAGVLGAFFVTVVIYAFPRIGPALTFGLVVAGQMVISVVLDHANILVAHPHPFNLYRLLGIVLIVAGVIIVRKF